MTKEELLAKLNGTEWDDFEVKEASRDIPKSVWESVSAFSNGKGGWILLGVRENKDNGISRYEIIGLNDIEKIEQSMGSTLRSTTKFNAPILASVEMHDFDGKKVLLYWIPPSDCKPIYLNNNLNNT